MFETMDLYWRLAGKFRLGKFRAVQLWQKIPDCFRLLDLVMIGAGLHVNPRSHLLKRIWNLHQALGYFQSFQAFLSMTSALICKEDIFAFFWSMLIFITTIHCLAKYYLLHRHNDKICELRSFLTYGSYSSEDSAFDAAARRRSQQRSTVLIIAVFVLMVLHQIVLWIPNEQQRVILHIPSWIGTYFGERFAETLRILYSSTFTLFWMPKLVGCTILSTVLLSGLKTEQIILSHRFEQLAGCLGDIDDQFWNHLKVSVRIAMIQQDIIMSHITNLRPMIEKLFFFIYYFAIGAIGCTFFLVLSVPFSVLNSLTVVALVVFSLEIYQLGYQVDCLQDAFESTANQALYLCLQLPYSASVHGRDYADVRSSLAIIGLCTRNMVRFGCAGISDISVVVYAQLLNVSYSVMTFLLNTV